MRSRTRSNPIQIDRSRCFLVIAMLLSIPTGWASAREIVGVKNFQIVSRLTGSPSQNQTTAVVGGTGLGHMVNHNGKTRRSLDQSPIFPSFDTC